MKIVILGAGQVGKTLATSLSTENNDIVVVDLDISRLQKLKERLDIGIVQGHASYPNILKKAGLEDADMLLAVTNNDETNMIACQVAYTLFDTPLKIARIKSNYYQEQKELFANEALPIDVIISPEALVTEYIRNLMKYPKTLQVVSFANNAVNMVTIKASKNSFITNKTINEIQKFCDNLSVRFATVLRHKKTLLIDNEMKISKNDEITFFVSKLDTNNAIKLFLNFQKDYNNIMIVGGGSIGYYVAKSLENDFKVKIIDNNPERVEYLAEKLTHSIVIEGDGSDLELLLEEDIYSTDVFCALTNNDGLNIMSSLLAKRLNAYSVISLITKGEYHDLIAGSEIDIAISPQQITANSVLKYIRRGDIAELHSSHSGNSEAIEVIVHGDKQTSNVVDHKISDIILPEQALIVTVIRDNRVIMDFEDLTIQENDHIIIFLYDKQIIGDIETLFQVNLNFL
tara:strand:+ start:3840 stop:5213 length:1374 start_codon:yes stop_codon:yes gene_type:complete